MLGDLSKVSALLMLPSPAAGGAEAALWPQRTGLAVNI